MQILLELFALEKSLDSGFQLIRDGLYLLKLRGIRFLLSGAHKQSSNLVFSAFDGWGVSMAEPLSAAMRFS